MKRLLYPLTEHELVRIEEWLTRHKPRLASDGLVLAFFTRFLIAQLRDEWERGDEYKLECESLRRELDCALSLGE